MIMMKMMRIKIILMMMMLTADHNKECHSGDPSYIYILVLRRHSYQKNKFKKCPLVSYDRESSSLYRHVVKLQEKTFYARTFSYRILIDIEINIPIGVNVGNEFSYYLYCLRKNKLWKVLKHPRLRIVGLLNFITYCLCPFSELDDALSKI